VKRWYRSATQAKGGCQDGVCVEAEAPPITTHWNSSGFVKVSGSISGSIDSHRVCAGTLANASSTALTRAWLSTDVPSQTF
jgi:hypothetical protein